MNGRFDIVLDVFQLSYSSCKETERKVKGWETALMSASGRLVTHIRSFGEFESIKSTKSIKTSRGDNRSDVFGHSCLKALLKLNSQVKLRFI